MIIGDGNIATVLTDREDVIFFASGVSDSLCTDEKEFKREMKLLLKQPDKHLVYFSSLGIYSRKSPYLTHKKEMEELVKSLFPSYTIVRLEVIAWGRNPTTIHNVFRQNIQEGKPVMIQDTFRYVVTKEEFQNWMTLIPVGEKNEMNIPGRQYHVSDIYQLVKDGVL